MRAMFANMPKVAESSGNSAERVTPLASMARIVSVLLIEMFDDQCSVRFSLVAFSVQSECDEKLMEQLL